MPGLLRPSLVLHLAAMGVTTLTLSIAGAEPPTDAQLAEQVDAAAAKVLRQPQAAGLSIAVARSGKVVLAKGYGMADVEWSVPVTAETVFRIGSVTKQFTAAAIMRLVEAGKVSLDATVQTYLPDFPTKQWPVTIRHLLTHTSGIWSYTEDGAFMTRDAGLELTPVELIATFRDKPLEFEPGTRYNYSNSAYYLLGMVVEKVSGKPYGAFVQEEFFSPLGLTRTRYENNGAIIPGRAQGYSFDNGVLGNDRPLGADVPGAAGSLLSTATDLVNWTTALTNGKVVSPESFIEMTTSATLKDGSATGYGLGLEVDMWEGRRRFAHGGGIFGFTSQLITLPDDEVTVAVLLNSEAMSPGKVADTVARLALGIPVFEPKDLSLSKPEIERFSGEFAFDDIPMEIRLFERDGKMWAQATGQGETQLYFQGGDEFRASFDPQVKIVFEAGSGDVFTLHQGGETRAKRKK